MTASLHQTVKVLQEQVWRAETSRRPERSGGLGASWSPLSAGGFRRGTLIELLAGPGGGATTLALVLAAEAACAGGATVVVDPQRRFFPPAAPLWGIDLERLILVHPATSTDYFWSLNQALRCPGVASVLSWPEKIDPRVFRGLQLAAEAGETLGIFLRPPTARGLPTWAETQLLVEAQPTLRGVGKNRRLQLEVLRTRGEKSGARLELELDDETGTVHSSRAVSLAPPVALATLR
ncbi:MAG TPA: hypothetical protein VFE24_08215 [Pirellulales bacterium]|nr:hypothetical protein [Pirellulales bacterium]